jgi:threonine dehydrogenase-like Zn-dependent dehydrogenase
MKYLTMKGPKTTVIKEVPDVKPDDGQILIKIKYVGVCMSEHYNWSTAKEGEAFGHEPMGFVAEVGKNVTGFAVGDRVSGCWGNPLPGGGGMIEYALANPAYDTVVKIPDNIRDEDAVLEPLGCLLSAVSKARVQMPGTRVCVVGAGYMGCGAISLLKLRGAHVTAVDIRPESLADAKKYGADEVYLAEEAAKKFIDPDNDCASVGFDVVMEWGETDESLDLAIRMTNMCGQLCVGAYHTGPKRQVNMQLLNVKAADCLSVHPREMDLLGAGVRNAAALLSNGSWAFKNVPTKVYPMNKFDQAHEELETKYGKYMKAIIDMTWEDGEPYIV